MPEAPLLQLQDIRKSFVGTRVLKGVSLEVAAGEVHALLGGNGAGKSTLIKILSGAYTRDSGEILMDGRPVRIHSPQDALALGIGVIYQEFNLVPELTVAENVLLGQEPIRRIAGIPILSRAGLMVEARRHLEELGFSLDPTRRVRDLTTGEKQLVEIAKALHRKARVLVLDEPTAALSRSETERLFATMRQLQQRQIGLIYISHHLEEVYAVSDRITVLRDGVNAGTWETAGVQEAELVRAIAGRDVETGSRDAGEFGDVVLEADHLSGEGFHDVSFRVRAGEILALTGAAGAGQTDLCWGLYGATRLRSGELRLRGRSARWRTLRDAIRAGVLLSPGDRKAYGLIPGLDVGVNFLFADLAPRTTAGILRRGKMRQDAEELIRRYGVRCTGPGQDVQSLSGGNQQKVVVGRVAERQAQAYLFDEPTRGVDVGAREDIYTLIHQLADQGAAVIVSTPDLREALRLGDRIGVMRAGRIVLETTRAEAREEELLQAVLGGEGAREAHDG